MLDQVHQIKDRLTVSEIIAEKIKLMRRGRYLLGKCPFHNEKTPSFTVNDSKQFYYCFGCGAHGDIFTFVMKMENMNFTDALSKLATKAGIVITTKVNYTHYYAILEQATEWAQHNISESVLQYLKSRHIGDDSIRRFQIGYVPNNGLKSYLQGQGHSLEKIVMVGLLSKNQKEYFYNRLIFPIHDHSGRVIAFGGRAFDDKGPKYLNSPETDLFKKSETLYGWHLAKHEDTEQIIIVEGYFDVIALSQIGLKNVVAPLGTALTIFHLQYICKLYKEVIVCFDGDEAGKNAILKTIKLVLATEYIEKLRFVIMPQGQDPCDIAMRDGVEVMQLLLQKAQPASQILWQLFSEEIDPKNPEEKVQLRNKLSEYTKDIQDFEVRRYYQDFFYKKLFYMSHKRPQRDSSYNLLSTVNTDLGERLLAIVLQCPDIVDDVHVEEKFATFLMENEELTKIQQHIITLMNDQNLVQLHQGNVAPSMQKMMDNIIHKHPFADQQQAYNMWQRIMLIMEIQELELEYNNAITHAMQDNHTDGRAQGILQRLLHLKTLLNNSSQL